MTRHSSWLLEIQPEVFVEMSRELAQEKGIANGDKVRVWNKRGAIVAVALVTSRIKPLTVQGKTVHQVGLPWHFGWVMPFDTNATRTPRNANRLTPNVGDPNTMIPETKAFLVNLEKADSSSTPGVAS
jgi:formate dehydrogenase major subunit